MRFNELRWCHLAVVLEHMRKGAAMSQAAQRAGISIKLWAKARSLWDELPAHLAQVDPTGSPVDLDRLNDLIRANLKNGGRPQGSKDTVRRARVEKEVVQPVLIVKSDLVYAEDGYFYDD